MVFFAWFYFWSACYLHGEEGLESEPKVPTKFKGRAPHFVEALSISNFPLRATSPHAEHVWYK